MSCTEAGYGSVLPERKSSAIDTTPCEAMYSWRSFSVNRSLRHQAPPWHSTMAGNGPAPRGLYTRASNGLSSWRRYSMSATSKSVVRSSTAVVMARFPGLCAERVAPWHRLSNGIDGFRPAALPPREHRLFEVGDAGSAADDQLAELIDHRGGGRVDQVAGDAHAHHAPVAFGNGDEVEGVGLGDFRERDAVHRGDLRRVGTQLCPLASPHHDRRDQIARAGRVIVQHPEHRVGAEIKPDLLV